MTNDKGATPKKENTHSVYVSDGENTPMIVASFRWKDDAFIKARECYEAFDTVIVTRTLTQPVHRP